MAELKQRAWVLAQSFHSTYERLAPSFGYETRPETRGWVADSPNGKLMRAVCEELIREGWVETAALSDKAQPAATELTNLKLDLQRILDWEPTLCDFPEVEAIKALLVQQAAAVSAQSAPAEVIWQCSIDGGEGWVECSADHATKAVNHGFKARALRVIDAAAGQSAPASKAIQQLRELAAVQAREAATGDTYMVGLFNGLELALATLENRDPKYAAAGAPAPAEDKPDGGSPFGPFGAFRSKHD